MDINIMESWIKRLMHVKLVDIKYKYFSRLIKKMDEPIKSSIHTVVRCCIWMLL